MLGSPCSSRAFSDSALAGAPIRPCGWLSGAALSNFGCGASPKPCGFCSTRAGLSSSARCSPSGWTSGREAFEFASRPGFLGAGMGRIWGESRDGGRAGEARRPATGASARDAKASVAMDTGSEPCRVISRRTGAQQLAYQTSQRGQVVNVDRPSASTLGAQLAPVNFVIDGVGANQVVISNLTLILEVDENEQVFVSTSNGYIVCENDRDAWKTDPFQTYSLDLKFTDGVNPVGDLISISYMATGKGGNNRPVPQNGLRAPYNGPFADIKALELYAKSVLIYLDEGEGPRRVLYAAGDRAPHGRKGGHVECAGRNWIELRRDGACSFHEPDHQCAATSSKPRWAFAPLPGATQGSCASSCRRKAPRPQSD